MKNPCCLRMLCGAFCPEPCLPFKAQVAGTFSGKLTWKAVQGQRNGFVPLCRSLGPWAGVSDATQGGDGPPNHLTPDPRRTKEKIFHNLKILNVIKVIFGCDDCLALEEETGVGVGSKGRGYCCQRGKLLKIHFLFEGPGFLT